MRPRYSRILERIQITEIVTYSPSNSFRGLFCLEGHLTMQLVLRLCGTEFTGYEQ
jgi:hypothetical protein